MASIDSIGSVTSMPVQSVVSAQPVAAATSEGTAQNTEVSAQVPVPQMSGTEQLIGMPKPAGASVDAAQSDEKNSEQLRKAVDTLNKAMPNSEVLFGYHEATHRIMLKVVDKDTKKVLYEFPPEKTLDMIAKVWEMAGILVDAKR